MAASGTILRQPQAMWDLLKATWREWREDRAARAAAALAFYTMFSLVPLLIIVIAVAGWVFGQEAAEGQVVAQIQTVVGANGARAVQTLLASVHMTKLSPSAAIVGVATLVFGAT